MQFLSLPQLIAALFLFSLAFVSLLAGYKERLWRTFSFFSALLGCAATCAFLFTIIPNKEISKFFFRLIPCFALSSFSIALYYISILTQLDFKKTVFNRKVQFSIMEKGYKIIFLNKEISYSHHIILTVLFFGSLFYFIVFTDLFIKNIQIVNSRFSIEAGPIVFIFLFLVIVSGIKSFVFLIQAKKKQPPGPRKKLIQTNIIGFSLIYLPLAVFVLLQYLLEPAFGPWFYLWIALSVTVFYLGIVRYQFETVEALNKGLEQKVEDRTRHLAEAQIKLAQAETMGALGRLVAGVAHEINNPLGFVMGSNQTIHNALERVTSEDTETQKGNAKYIQIIKDSASVMDSGLHRIKEVVLRLKSFARLDESLKQTARVDQDLKNALSLIHFPKGIKLKQEIQALPPIYCSPVTLNQVWSNLVFNAIQAIEHTDTGRGEITVKATSQNNHIEVMVADNGCGIKVADLNAIYKPGFTTKGVKVGTGLGLSICYEIIREHGGNIDVQSEWGKGTTLLVTLPIS